MLNMDKSRLIEFAVTNMGEPVSWRDPKNCSAIGWERDGWIVAAVVYDQFFWPSISGHIVSDGSRNWACRAFIRAMFDYPFRQLECARITAPVADGNSQAIRFLEKLGFKLEGRLRKAMPDGRDRLIFGILKEECKWL
jgi:RimJ/RimL family protein N-acetyltransferase